MKRKTNFKQMHLVDSVLFSKLHNNIQAHSKQPRDIIIQKELPYHMPYNIINTQSPTLNKNSSIKSENGLTVMDSEGQSPLAGRVHDQAIMTDGVTKANKRSMTNKVTLLNKDSMTDAYSSNNDYRQQENMEIDQHLVVVPQNRLAHQSRIPIQYNQPMQALQTEPMQTLQHQPIQHIPQLPHQDIVPRYNMNPVPIQSMDVETNKDCNECDDVGRAPKPAISYSNYNQLVTRVPQPVSLPMHTGLPEIKIFQCELCGSVYKRYNSLLRHMNQIHESYNQTEKGEKRQQIFPCEICYTNFKSKKALDRHEGNVHTAFFQEKKGTKRKHENENHNSCTDIVLYKRYV
jgi:uncharacterized C2H2 Zn-finger protein